MQKYYLAHSGLIRKHKHFEKFFLVRTVVQILKKSGKN